MAAVLLVPTYAGVHLTTYTDAAVFALLFVSRRLLVVTSGQVSLCQAGLAAVGATTFSHLVVGQGWPWPLALTAAGLVAVPVGASSPSRPSASPVCISRSLPSVSGSSSSVSSIPPRSCSAGGRC